jgi:hypothetical protein
MTPCLLFGVARLKSIIFVPLRDGAEGGDLCRRLAGEKALCSKPERAVAHNRDDDRRPHCRAAATRRVTPCHRAAMRGGLEFISNLACLSVSAQSSNA